MDRERIGKYRIVGEIGRGTMGEVYKAHDPVLNRFVALKTLAIRVGPADEALERFQREAQAAALLNHPNIVTVHDFGQEDGLLYMAMELLVGTDLRAAIDENRLATLDDKLDVLDAVLVALDYAHGKGVVHRDVKPANIHLAGLEGGSARQVKIMDFGLAKVGTSEMTQEGIVLGTPNYMSPEQALGDRVDGRTDLFAAGAMLYELLTAHKPFEADSTPSVLFQVVHRQPPPVRRWNPDAPSALAAVVNRALEKDRDRRFASAGEMRAALEAARRTTVVAAALEPPPLPPRATRAEAGAPPPSGALGTAGFQPEPFPTPPPIRATSPIPPPRATRRERRPLGPFVLGGGLAAAALVAGGIAYWLREASSPIPSAAPSAQVGALTGALVATTAQLAQRELADKNYGAAAKQAESTLRLAPGHPGATRVLAEARERLQEIDTAVAEARRQVTAGNTQAASEQLSHLLELDPRHPAATELSAQLNDVFRQEAGKAAVSMRAARAMAVSAGLESSDLGSEDESAREADKLAASGEFADATRTYLEARDAYDRARRAALMEHAPTPSPAISPAAEKASPVAPGPAPAATTLAAPEPTTPAPAETAAPLPARSFQTESTTVATPSAGTLKGFDGTDVKTRRPPEFSGRLEFEVLPRGVRPEEPFVVRIHLLNAGRKPVHVRGLAVATVIDGERAAARAKALQREVEPQKRGLVAEYSGVWRECASWTLEAVVTVDRNETVSSRVRSQ
jgi:serine/threonine protein kinase